MVPFGRKLVTNSTDVVNTNRENNLFVVLKRILKTWSRGRCKDVGAAIKIITIAYFPVKSTVPSSRTTKTNRRHLQHITVTQGKSEMSSFLVGDI